MSLEQADTYFDGLVAMLLGTAQRERRTVECCGSALQLEPLETALTSSMALAFVALRLQGVNRKFSEADPRNPIILPLHPSFGDGGPGDVVVGVNFKDDVLSGGQFTAFRFDRARGILAYPSHRTALLFTPENEEWRSQETANMKLLREVTTTLARLYRSVGKLNLPTAHKAEGDAYLSIARRHLGFLEIQKFLSRLEDVCELADTALGQHWQDAPGNRWRNEPGEGVTAFLQQAVDYLYALRTTTRPQTFAEDLDGLAHKLRASRSIDHVLYALARICVDHSLDLAEVLCVDDGNVAG